MAGRLSDRVALVTGAAQGIGEGIAEVLAEAGARVVVADIQRERGEAVAARLGGGAMFLPLDVRDPAAWAGAVATLRERCGRIDVLVNNAGGGIAGPIEDTAIEAHRGVVSLNLDAVWIGIRAVVAAMPAGGSIVNISSIDGIVGVPHLSSYVATKFAVTGLTRSLAIELGPRGVRVNSVHPGIVETPLVRATAGAMRERLDRAVARQPIPRMGTPRDIGQAVLFFAGAESAFCTGASLVVDGGHIAGPYREPLDGAE